HGSASLPAGRPRRESSSARSRPPRVARPRATPPTAHRSHLLGLDGPGCPAATTSPSSPAESPQATSLGTVSLYVYPPLVGLDGPGCPTATASPPPQESAHATSMENTLIFECRALYAGPFLTMAARPGCRSAGRSARTTAPVGIPRHAPRRDTTPRPACASRPPRPAGHRLRPLTS